ncbi:MAG: methyltransferase domain-containing protein, partial [Acidimicrobiia bacterium]|nr:methyltransferase domain-containing protein [Acidimicrobiia bacterium]
MPKRSELLRLFLAEQRDPQPFYRRLAADAVERLPFPVAGARLLDLGCGPGHYTRALRAAGAVVLPVDLDGREFFLPGGPPGGHVVGDGGALPVATASLDGVLCSNMLEHTPDPRAVI